MQLLIQTSNSSSKDSLSGQSCVLFKTVAVGEISAFCFMFWLSLEEIPGDIIISSMNCFFFPQFKTIMEEWECQSVFLFILVLCQLNLSLQMEL